MKRFLLLFTLLNVLCFTHIHSQNQTIFKNNYESINDTTKLSLEIYSSFFFKNNEYFNNLTDGITFLGTIINPSLVYKPLNNVSIKAGWYGLKYSGQDLFNKSLPYFQLNYLPIDGICIVMGNLYSARNHNLIEPLISYDSYFYSNPESGVQILINKIYFKSDIWLNWEKFILPGYKFNEEFTFGINSEIILFPENNNFNITFPFAVIAKHKGGQISTNKTPIQTFYNNKVGLKLIKRLTTNNVINLESYYLMHTDESHKKILKYKSGSGIYITTNLKLNNWDFLTGLWMGNKYISQSGEQLFQSVSNKYSSYSEPTKNLILAKAGYSKNLNNNISIGIGSSLYYDINRNTPDYFYQIFFILNERFFISNLQAPKY